LIWAAWLFPAVAVDYPVRPSWFEAIAEVIGGRIVLTFDNLASIGPHVKAGRESRLMQSVSLS